MNWNGGQGRFVNLDDKATIPHSKGKQGMEGHEGGLSCLQVVHFLAESCGYTQG